MCVSSIVYEKKKEKEKEGIKRKHNLYEQREICITRK